MTSNQVDALFALGVVNHDLIKTFLREKHQCTNSDIYMTCTYGHSHLDNGAPIILHANDDCLSVRVVRKGLILYTRHGTTRDILLNLGTINRTSVDRKCSVCGYF